MFTVLVHSTWISYIIGPFLNKDVHRLMNEYIAEHLVNITRHFDLNITLRHRLDL